MSDIQDQIANDYMQDYLRQAPKQIREIWDGTMSSALDMVEAKPDAAAAAVAAVLLNQWADMGELQTLSDRAFRYAVARAGCHEIDVEHWVEDLPDNIEDDDE